MLMSAAWFYGGIRSIGRHVCVLDTNGKFQACYRVKGSRRKLRQRLREEYSDALVMIDIWNKPTKN